MPALVVGIGNTLRGDDGIGPYVALALVDRGRPADRVLGRSVEGIARDFRYRRRA